MYNKTPRNPLQLRVLSRDQHPISRKNISAEALKVLYRLHRLGYKAFIAGGGVRDLLMNRRPKDFDVATDARPRRLRKIFRNCRIIGKRFKIAHIFFSAGTTIEVTTFRKAPDASQTQKNGMILRDNRYGTPEEDALRRDITINGLFYDISTFSVLDYVGGVRDLENGIVRTISEPGRSFKEDPVRMIRALRHAARLEFEVEEETYKAILEHRHLLSNVNPSRMAEEIYRDLRNGASMRFFRKISETGLMALLFPRLAEQIRRHPSHPLWDRLRVLDERVRNQRQYSDCALMALLFYSVLLPGELTTRRKKSRGDIGKVVHENLRSLRKHFRVSLKFSHRINQIIMASRRLKASSLKGGIPRPLRGKSYLPEALQFYEILQQAAGNETEQIRSLLDSIQPAEQTGRSTSKKPAARKRSRKREKRQKRAMSGKKQPKSRKKAQNRRTDTE